MIKSEILNQKSKINSKFYQSQKGFTLIELIIYLAIVSGILISISYLILDIMGGQTKSYAGQEVNYNLQFITNSLTKDIQAAKDISSLATGTLVLTLPTANITYNFNPAVKTLTRQDGDNPVLDVNTNQVEITGSFTDQSRLGRTKNVNIHLAIIYKNPGNLPDYNASTTVDFSAELRGRR